MSFLTHKRARGWKAAAAIVGCAALLAACGANGDEDTAPDETADTDADSEADTDEDAGDAAADGAFFEGQTIEFTVPFGPGGGSDNTARYVQDALEERVAGNPQVQVVNVEGGGSVLGGNEYELLKPHDGTHILITSSSTVLPYLVGEEAVEYDLREFEILFAHPAGRTVYVRPELGVETAADLLNPAEPIVAPGRGPTGADLLTILGFDMLGILDDVQFVFGYDSGGAQALAYEQGEGNLNHRPTGTTVSTDWYMVEEGIAEVIYTHGSMQGGEVVPDAALADYPTIVDAYVEMYGEEPSGIEFEVFKTFTELVGTAGYAIWIHGDAPEEAIEALQEAFVEMAQDEEWVEGLQELVGPYDPLVGDDLNSYRAALADLPEDHLQYVRDLLEEKYDVDGLG